MSVNQLSTGPASFFYPWKKLSETMRATGCAVLSLPPSPTLFRAASEPVKEKRRRGRETEEQKG